MLTGLPVLVTSIRAVPLCWVGNAGILKTRLVAPGEAWSEIVLTTTPFRSTRTLPQVGAAH